VVDRLSKSDLTRVELIDEKHMCIFDDIRDGSWVARWEAGYAPGVMFGACRLVAAESRAV
jgi:hypothetical protein